MIKKLKLKEEFPQENSWNFINKEIWSEIQLLKQEQDLFGMKCNHFIV
jgi:hypothetical protein